MIRRTAMRALLVDLALEQILLIQALVPDTGDKLWFTPGGGKEGDESDEVCLAREIREETGLSGFDEARLVWTRSEQFVFLGESYHQEERYFWVPVARFDVVQQTLEAHEEETFLEARWWGLDDICVSNELFVPADLGEQVRRLVRAHRSGNWPVSLTHVGR